MRYLAGAWIWTSEMSHKFMTLEMSFIPGNRTSTTGGSLKIAKQKDRALYNARGGPTDFNRKTNAGLTDSLPDLALPASLQRNLLAALRQDSRLALGLKQRVAASSCAARPSPTHESRPQATTTQFGRVKYTK